LRRRRGDTPPLQTPSIQEMSMCRVIDSISWPGAMIPLP
jgi:hypothetical protein